MLPRANGTAYEFLFAALPEPVEYYVEAAGVKSKTFKLDVADLPGIKHIKVTYHFPVWLGHEGCGGRSGRRSARRCRHGRRTRPSKPTVRSRTA